MGAGQHPERCTQHAERRVGELLVEAGRRVDPRAQQGRLEFCERVGPGTIVATTHRSGPGHRVLAHRRDDARRTTLDFPDPLGPTRVTSWAPPPTRVSMSAMSRSRPKKSSASDSWKACRPLNGLPAVATGVGRPVTAASR